MKIEIDPSKIREAAPLRNYLPAVWIALGAIFFMAFPNIAAFLVVSGLMFCAFLYAFVVYRFHQFRKRMADAQARAEDQAQWGGGFASDFSNMQEPNFRNIAVYISSGKNWR